VSGAYFVAGRAIVAQVANHVGLAPNAITVPAP
jgi:hypothetical protein